MICVDDGKITVKGTHVNVMAELTVLMHSLIVRGDADEDELAHCVALATMTDAEVAELSLKCREAVALASMLFGEIE